MTLASVLALQEMERRLRVMGAQLKEEDQMALCQAAQKVWVEGYGSPRHAGTSRGSNWRSGLKLAAKRKDAGQCVHAFFVLKTVIVIVK